jgi:hypothetical protein
VIFDPVMIAADTKAGEAISDDDRSERLQSLLEELAS